LDKNKVRSLASTQSSDTNKDFGTKNQSKIFKLQILYMFHKMKMPYM